MLDGHGDELGPEHKCERQVAHLPDALRPGIAIFPELFLSLLFGLRVGGGFGREGDRCSRHDSHLLLINNPHPTGFMEAYQIPIKKLYLNATSVGGDNGLSRHNFLLRYKFIISSWTRPQAPATQNGSTVCVLSFWRVKMRPWGVLPCDSEGNTPNGA